MVHSRDALIPGGDLSALIARLEAAEAGSSHLDGEIQWMLDGTDYGPKSYTTSLDAALALAERVGFPAYSGEIQPSGRWKWKIASNAPLGASVRGPKWPSGVAKTPSLALCIAILKAKAQGEGG